MTLVLKTNIGSKPQTANTVTATISASNLSVLSLSAISITASSTLSANTTLLGNVTANNIIVRNSISSETLSANVGKFSQIISPEISGLQAATAGLASSTSNLQIQVSSLWNNKVPYIGATANVNLASYSITANSYSGISIIARDSISSNTLSSGNSRIQNLIVPGLLQFNSLLGNNLTANNITYISTSAIEIVTTGSLNIAGSLDVTGSNLNTFIARFNDSNSAEKVRISNNGDILAINSITGNSVSGLTVSGGIGKFNSLFVNDSISSNILLAGNFMVSTASLQNQIDSLEGGTASLQNQVNILNTIQSNYAVLSATNIFTNSNSISGSSITAKNTLSAGLILAGNLQTSTASLLSRINSVDSGTANNLNRILGLESATSNLNSKDLALETGTGSNASRITILENIQSHYAVLSSTNIFTNSNSISAQGVTAWTLSAKTLLAGNFQSSTSNLQSQINGIASGTGNNLNRILSLEGSTGVLLSRINSTDSGTASNASNISLLQNIQSNYAVLTAINVFTNSNSISASSITAKNTLSANILLAGNFQTSTANLNNLISSMGSSTATLLSRINSVDSGTASNLSKINGLIGATGGLASATSNLQSQINSISSGVSGNYVPYTGAIVGVNLSAQSLTASTVSGLTGLFKGVGIGIINPAVDLDIRNTVTPYIRLGLIKVIGLSAEDIIGIYETYGSDNTGNYVRASQIATVHNQLPSSLENFNPRLDFKLYDYNGGVNSTLPKMSILNNGNVGIGTTGATKNLEVSSTATPTIRLNKSGDYADIYNDGNLHIDGAASNNFIIFSGNASGKISSFRADANQASDMVTILTNGDVTISGSISSNSITAIGSISSNTISAGNSKFTNIISNSISSNGLYSTNTITVENTNPIVQSKLSTSSNTYGKLYHNKLAFTRESDGSEVGNIIYNSPTKISIQSLGGAGANNIRFDVVAGTLTALTIDTEGDIATPYSFSANTISAGKFSSHILPVLNNELTNKQYVDSLTAAAISGSASGTIGTIAKFNSVTSLTNSIITESGTLINVAGSISAQSISSNNMIVAPLSGTQVDNTIPKVKTINNTLVNSSISDDGTTVTINAALQSTGQIKANYSSGVIIAGNGSGAPVIGIDGAASNVRDVRYYSGGVLRWIVRANGTAESGSNVGSDFQILSRDDAGVALRTDLQIVRATGAVTWGGGNHSGFGTISSGAITSTSTIQATTAKLTDLTDGYIPYHVSDASGLANSLIFQTGNFIGIRSATPNSEMQILQTDNGLVNIGSGNIPTGSKGLQLGYRYTADYADIQAIHQGTAYKNIALNGAGGAVFVGYTSDPTSGNKFAVNGNAYFNGTLTVTDNILPLNDNTISLGTSSKRWSDIFAAQSTIGGLFESGLKTDNIGNNVTGTVVAWYNGKLVPCYKEKDSRVMGVIKHGKDEPIILGAEYILITGKIKEGDFIVTSKKLGHGKAVKNKFLKIFNRSLTGKIIGQALEDAVGDSNLIKAYIYKH